METIAGKYLMQPQQIKELQQLLAKSRYCRLETKGELPIFSVQHPLFEAEIIPQGAQLTRFRPVQDSEWLWLSPTVEYKTGTSLRGGVPVCWPWFGDADKNPQAVQDNLNDANSAPAHGFARSSDWQLTGIEEDEQRLTLALTLPQQTTPEYFTARLQADIRFVLSADAVRIELTTTNHGDSPVCFSQALHSYFPVEDVLTAEIHGLEGCEYIDTLDQWQRKTQKGAVVFRGETDRIYLSQPPAGGPAAANGQGNPLILKSGLEKQHNRTLTSLGSQSTIVWNPEVEKSIRLSQFPDDGWKHMMCIETANAMDDVVWLAPEESHLLAVTLS